MKSNSKLVAKRLDKKGIIWRYIIYVIGICSMSLFLLRFVPVKKRKKHSMFKRDHTLVMAHRGGAGLAPENTLAAFRNAVTLGVDIIELDVHITSDGHLVVIHDNTINRTTNGTGNVHDLTVAEIQSYDAGFRFIDPDGNTSFRGKGVIVPTLEEVFQAMPSYMRYTIEFKDTNDPALHTKIGKDLWDLMQMYDVQDRVLIGSFNQQILDMMTAISNGNAIVSAGKLEVAKFVLLHKLGLSVFYQTKVDSLEIPMKAGGINLVDKKLINAAKTRGIDIHYWTINDRETMSKLIDLGADGIISDRPDLLLKLLEE